MADAPDINVDELRRRARRRLLGAVVLALAAAVLIPMLLESDPKPLGEDVSVKIPPVDNGKFVNRLSDKGAKTTAPNAPKSESAKEGAKVELPKVDSPKMEPPPAAPAETTSAPSNVPAPKKSIVQAEQKMLGAPTKSAAPATTVPPPATVATASPASSAATAPPAASAMAPATGDVPREGFSVQLAAFADDKGANSLANKLKNADYPAYTEPLTTSKGTLWRVRVGPYATRDEATAIRDKLKGEGHSGIVAAAK